MAAEKYKVEVKYTLSKFESDKAKASTLVAMVDKNTYGGDSYQHVSNIDNDAFKGSGVAKYRSTNGKFGFSVDGENYLFDNKGESADSVSYGYKLMMAVIEDEVANNTGSVAIGTNKRSYTRAGDGSIEEETRTYEGEGNTILIESLNARDRFAIQALNSLISRMEEDPATLSDDTISHYCQQAYRYAAYMMTAAANVRAELLRDETEKETNEEVEVGELESNTEKLLNNLVVSQKKTDYEETEDGEKIYSERIINPKLNKLIKDAQEEIDGEKYNRVKVHELDKIKEAVEAQTTAIQDFTSLFSDYALVLGIRLQDIVLGLDNINDSIKALKSNNSSSTNSEESI